MSTVAFWQSLSIGLSIVPLFPFLCPATKKKDDVAYDGESEFLDGFGKSDGQPLEEQGEV